MADKEFKTIDEQINILKSRGLTICQEEQAKSFLFHNNYYRISGYSLTLRKNNIFAKSATFQNIIDIYSFDHEFRHVLLKYIEIIEVSFKSVYTYYFTEKYGGTGYLNKDIFSDENQYEAIMKKANIQKDKRLQHEAYLKHFINERRQNLPLWAFVDLLTIADISLLYKVTETDLKKVIAAEFGLAFLSGDIILGKFMHSMTIIRNLSAHGGRLFNRLFEQKPSLNKNELSLLIKSPDGTFDNSHLYGFIIIMKRLLSLKEFTDLKTEIINLTTKYPFVRMDYYGFRQDWEEKL